MPGTEVRAFRESDGKVPILEWLNWLEVREPKAYAKCLARIIQLAEAGFDMRRPHADTLRDGIHELRATTGNRHYRILYFFYGKNAVALSHGLTKEAEVPDAEIDLAIERKKLVKLNPDICTADLEL
ncbi:MAG TPA: type II toxin-antitoxin system RelE/ParE family toxin [Pirellulales bacterium]|jgi:phage-related protein